MVMGMECDLYVAKLIRRGEGLSMDLHQLGDGQSRSTNCIWSNCSMPEVRHSSSSKLPAVPLT
jgi:hypothetical protein